MAGRLKGKVAPITAAGQGIGRAMAAAEAAALAVFRAGNESSYIAVLPHLADGGMAL